METIKLLTRGLRQSNEFYIFFFFFQDWGLKFLDYLNINITLVCMYVYTYIYGFPYGFPGGSGGQVLPAM